MSTKNDAKNDAKNEVPEEDEDLSSYAEDVESIAHTEDDLDESMGSLKDFIVSEDDDDMDLDDDSGDDDDGDGGNDSDDEEDSNGDTTEEEEIPKDDIDPKNIVTGKRTVKQVQKFVPEGMEQLMLTKGGAVEIEYLISSSDSDSDSSIHLEDQESEYSPSSDDSDDDN